MAIFTISMSRRIDDRGVCEVFAKERPINGKGSFRAYLYKTARNLTIRHTQKHKLWFLHLDEVDFELPSEELVETRLLQNEREKCLYEAMAKLKTEYREALYLVSNRRDEL